MTAGNQENKKFYSKSDVCSFFLLKIIIGIQTTFGSSIHRITVKRVATSAITTISTATSELSADTNLPTVLMHGQVCQLPLSSPNIHSWKSDEMSHHISLLVFSILTFRRILHNINFRHKLLSNSDLWRIYHHCSFQNMKCINCL